MVADLPVGTTVTVEITYTISPNFQGISLNNAAEITEDGPYDDIDSNPETGPETDEDGDGDGDDDDEDEVTIPVTQTYDLSLTKDLANAADAPFTQGDALTYTITVTNEGSLDAAGIVVTDRADAGLTFVSADVTGTNVTDNGDETFTIADLAQGESVSFTVTYQIGATFQGSSVRNEAEITEDDGDDEDSTPDNDDEEEDDQDEEETPLDQTYDLSLTKDLANATDAPFTQGDALTYTITVTNEGSLDASGVVVTDRADAGLTFVSADVTGTNVTDNGDETFTIADLAQGESVSFTVTYQIGATFQGNSVRNEAEITEDDGDDEDSTPDNDDEEEDDQDEEETPLDQTYDLSLTKDLANAADAPFTQGDALTYTITVTNEGSLDASGVVVTDRADAGLTFVSADVMGTNVTDNGDETFTIADLAQGESVSFTVTYQIGATFQGNSVRNEAEITEDDGDDEDSTPDNDDEEEDDQDEEETPLDQTYDLSLTKDLANAADAPFTQGDALTYTITVTNEGSLDASGVVVTDRADAGLTFVSADVTGTNVTDNGDETFTIADLAQGESVSFTVTYQIGATFQGNSVRNEAEITEDDGDDEDSTPDNDDEEEDDQDEEETPLDQTYDLSLTKDLANAADAPFTQGDALTYTITVTNEGSLDASGVVVTDRADAGLTFVSADVTGTNVTDNGDETFTIADLAQGESVSFTVTYQIGATFQGSSVRNEAEITEDDGDDEDSTPDNDDEEEDDQDEEETPLDQTYDLSLTKTVTSAGPYAPGSSVEYTVTVTNEGSLDAAGIEVTDTPQAGLTFASVVPQIGITGTGNGSFTVASLPQGESVQVVINYTIDATFQGSSLNNAAEITEDDGDDTDSNPETGPETDEDGDGDGDDDDEDNVNIPVDQTPMVDIEKATFDPIVGIFKDADVFSAATAPRYIWSRSDPDANGAVGVRSNQQWYAGPDRRSRYRRHRGGNRYHSFPGRWRERYTYGFRTGSGNGHRALPQRSYRSWPAR